VWAARRFLDLTHRPTGLAEVLQKQRISHVFVCGLAFDYCAGATACDAAELGFTTYLVDDLCRSVSGNSETDMRASLKAANVQVVQSGEMGHLLENLAEKPVVADIVPTIPERAKSPLSSTHYKNLSAGYQAAVQS
jgi:nicotinamidase-related amidase